MDLSMRWLADYVDCKCDIKKFCDEMTLFFENDLRFLDQF